MRKSSFRTYRVLTGILVLLGTVCAGRGLAETATDVDCKACVGNRDLGRNAVKAKSIRNNAVTNRKIKDGAVTSSKIADGSITAEDLAPGLLESDPKSEENGNDSVTSDEIVDGTIVAEDLADDAVTGPKIKDESIAAEDLGPASVGTSELQDEAVTNTKLAEGAVSTPEIEDGAVTTSKLSPDVLDAARYVASGEALRSSNVSLPQSTTAVMLSLEDENSDVSTGLLVIPFDGHLMAQVSLRLTPTGNPGNAQCRLFHRRDDTGASSSMTNYIPRIFIPDNGITTSLVGFSRVTAGTYDVSLRCGAGFSGRNAPSLATLEEAQVIVWALAN